MFSKSDLRFPRALESSAYLKLTSLLVWSQQLSCSWFVFLNTLYACNSHKLNIIWDDWLNTFIFSKFLNFYRILWTSEQHLTFTFLTTFPGNGYRLCARIIGRTMHRTAIYIGWLKYRTVSRQQSSYPAILGVVRESRESLTRKDTRVRGACSLEARFASHYWRACSQATKFD